MSPWYPARRACRMAISRDARSLLDFPEFAQAVRYGVPGTHAGGIERVPSRFSLFLPSDLRIGPGSDATVSDLQAFRGYAAEVMGCCGASFWAESELGDAPGKEASS